MDSRPDHPEDLPSSTNWTATRRVLILSSLIDRRFRLRSCGFAGLSTSVPIVAAMTLCVVGAVVSCMVNHDNSTNGPIGPVQDNPADHVGNNSATILAALAALGIELAPTGGTSRAELLYPAPGEAYRMDPATAQSKERLYIHRYPSAKAASDHAARIIQDDQMVHGTILWVNWPHFFRCDRLIVLYLGEQEKVIEGLSALCGPQFAGT